MKTKWVVEVHPDRDLAGLYNRYTKSFDSKNAALEYVKERKKRANIVYISKINLYELVDTWQKL